MPLPTDRAETERSIPGSVRCGLYRLTPRGPTRAGLIRPGDALVLWIEIQAGSRPRQLAIEFWRGERLRDRWERRLGPGTGEALAFRLHWSTEAASSRLTCRVLIDGREMARPTALLGPDHADAQGRLAADGPSRDASPATLLEFARELQRQIDGFDGS